MKIRWFKQVLHGFIVKKDSAGVYLSVTGTPCDGFIVTAVEVPDTSVFLGKPVMEVAGLVFDAHAHEVVGKRPAKTLEQGKRQAVRYARAWLRRPVPTVPCSCGSIQ